MSLPTEHVQAIVELETRHEEMFRLLEDLERRVACVLGQFQGARPEAISGAVAAAPAAAATEPTKAAA